MTKLSPDKNNFTEQMGQFRITKKDREFLESYAHEIDSGMADILRLAISNLREAVAKAKKKKPVQSKP